MGKGTVESKEQFDEKNPQVKDEPKNSCGCGCIPTVKKK